MNRKERREADEEIQRRKEQFATNSNGGGTGSNAGNILGFTPLTGGQGGNNDAGGYGMGLPGAEAASGQTPAVNPFIIPKGTGLTQITQAFPNYFFVDWSITSWREASNQCILQGWGIRWSALVIWAYQSSPFVQSLFKAIGRAIDQIPFFVTDLTGKQIPELTAELCDKSWELQLRREIALSVFWGFVGLNFDPVHEQVYKYPMQNIDPINRMLRASTFDLGDGVFFGQKDNLLYVQPSTSDEDFLGMMQPISRMFILMNENDINQVQAGRRLAFPILTVNYPQDDNAMTADGQPLNPFFAQAKSIAQNLDLREAVVLPYTYDEINKENRTSIDIDFKAPGSSNGMSKIFSDFNEQHKNDIRELVLGGILTATTGKNGNRSLGDTQEKKFDTVINSIAVFITSVLNSDYKRKICKFYKGINPMAIKFDYDKSKKWTLDEIEGMSNVLFQSGMRFTPEAFEEFGLPQNFIEPNPAAAPKAMPEPSENRFGIDPYWLRANQILEQGEKKKLIQHP